MSHGAAAMSCCVRVIGTCVACVACAGRATMTRRGGGGGDYRKVCRGTCRDMGKLQHHERVGTERHHGSKVNFPRAGQVRDVVPVANFSTLHCRTHVAQTLLHVIEELVLCCAL